jgi:integrase
MTDLALCPPTQLARVTETASNYANLARSDATKRAYASQLAGFAKWCTASGVSSFPAEPASVANYLASRAKAGSSVATLAQALTALSRAHVAAGYPSPRLDPVLREVWAGICRTEGTKPRREARAMPVEELRRLSRAAKHTLGARDRALLLLGFAGGFRRAELVALDVADVRDDADGLVVTLHRSKTDQVGAGREVGIPYGSDPVTCPVRAVRTWLELAGIGSGPIFRGVTKGGQVGATRLTGRSVSLIIKRAAKRARVPVSGLSGHSLRAGLVTAASKAGKSTRAIQDQTGHKSAAMVARYQRRATIFEDCAAAGIGL